MTNEFIKNIEHRQILELTDLVEYEKGKISSLTLVQKPGVGITVFAFDEGEGVSTHAAPGDAMVVGLDGEAVITIDGKEHRLKAGQTIIMPANVPHAVKAATRFKMLLTVVK